MDSFLNLTPLPVQQKIAGFSRESKLLQTIGSDVVDQLHSPLRPISSPRLYQGNPFQLSLHIQREELSGKGRSLTGELNRQKWKPDNHITRHTWSVCRNTDNNEHGFVHFSSMTSNFLDSACTKIQNMAFKTSIMDQIAFEYWYFGFLGRLGVDGRGFLHQKPILKRRSPKRK